MYTWFEPVVVGERLELMLAMLGRSNNFLKFSSNHTICLLFSLALHNLTLKYIEGNGHFGLLKFKHFRNSMGPETLECAGLRS